MPTPMLKIHVDGCHGNNAFFRNGKELILRDKKSLHFGVPMNDLAHMKNCHGGCKVAPEEFYVSS